MSASNPEPLLVSDALLRRAEQVSQARLTKDPDNPALLESLAQIFRKLGTRQDAARLYGRLAELDPENQEAAYRYALLAGIEGPQPTAGIQPAPFFLIENFLPPAFHETLLTFALSIENQLTPATVGNDEYNPEARESLELRGPTDMRARFRAHVLKILPTVISRLHVTPFESVKVEVKLRTYLDGHFFRTHMDNPPSSPNADRRVSFTYFYHKVPRAYTGGDLLLFDTDIENNLYTTSSFTRVQPEDNSIVFFPSACYHAVLPVSCPSKAFEDSRFVINGHVHRPAEVTTATESPADVVVTS